ncbi:MAG: c-type cytochrome [Woeseiaceae bacterium]
MGRYQVSIKIILLFYLLLSSILAADEITNLKETSIHKNMDEFFNFGRTATIEEIKEWDLDVSPDGTGLPEGTGTVEEGEILYTSKCLFCHGVNGEGGINERLVSRAGEEFPDEDVACGFECRTIGNYWPYATTLYDYILRSMPMNAPGSLTNDEVYSISAYLLYLNRIISEDTQLNAENLKNIVMPARDKFINDDRLNFKIAH